MSERMTRKDFLQKLGLSALGIAILGHSLSKPIIAEAGINDNLPSGSGGVKYDTSAPANPNMLWINPDESEAGRYYDGNQWKTFTSKSVVKSTAAPVNKDTLWLNLNNSALYWHNGTSWVPVYALWA